MPYQLAFSNAAGCHRPQAIVPSPTPGASVVVRRVFRLGVVEVGPGYVRYFNKTASGFVTLNEEQESRWRRWIKGASPEMSRAHQAAPKLGAIRGAAVFAVVFLLLAGCAKQYHPTLVCLPGEVHGYAALICVDREVFKLEDNGQGH